MQQAQIPTKFAIPWGNSAGAPYIRTVPQASQIGIQAGAASLTDGFPPLTFVQEIAGGVPPFGADVNGVLRQITQWIRWQEAGAPLFYDSSFSASISGYPKGALLASTAASGRLWLSTVDDNVTNPDAAGAGWTSFGPSAEAFDTRALAAAATILPDVNVVTTLGYTARGTGGGIYMRVVAQPSHAGWFQDASGAYFELRVAEANPYQFGAKGDDSADDTTALNNWLAYINVYKVGRLTTGIFRAPNGGLTLPNGAVIEADGGAIIKQTTTAVTPLVLGSSLTGTKIRNWTLQYSGTATPANGDNCAFRFNACTGCVIEDSTVNGPFYVGIEDRTGTQNTIRGCRVNGVQNRAIYPSSIGSAGSNSYTDNFVSGAALYTIVQPDSGNTVLTGGNLTAYGINCNGFGLGSITDYVIEGNTIVSTQYQGISTGDRCYGIISGNNINNVVAGPGASVHTGVGILVQKANGNSDTDILVAGNRVTGCDHGIEVTECFFVTVNGNIVLTTAFGDGIQIVTSQYGTVSNNVVRNGASNGIHLNTTCVGFGINGNTMVSNTGSGILGDGTNSRCVATGNVANNTGTNYSLGAGITAGTNV